MAGEGGEVVPNVADANPEWTDSGYYSPHRPLDREPVRKKPMCMAWDDVESPQAACPMPSRRYGVGSDWAGLGGLGFREGAEEPVWRGGKPPGRWQVAAWMSWPDGRSHKLVRYKYKSLAGCGFLMVLRGTVFWDRFMWLQTMLYAGWSILCFWGGRTYKQHGPTKELTGPTPHYEFLTSSMLSSIATLVSFLLAGLLGRQIVQWNKLRHTNLQTLLDACTDIIADFCIYVPDNSPEVLDMKETILRYALTSVELTFLEAHMYDTWNPTQRKMHRMDMWREILEEGLLTEDEIDILPKGSAAPQCLWVWIGNAMNAVSIEGMHPDPIGNVGRVAAICRRARTHIRTILGQMETQEPFPFMHLISWMVKTYLIVFLGLNSFTSGMHDAVFDPNKGKAKSNIEEITKTWTKADPASAIPWAIMVLFLPVYYQGLLACIAKMQNPFGNDNIDFPRRIYMNRCASECRAIIRAAAISPVGFNQLPLKKLKVTGFAKPVETWNMQGLASKAKLSSLRRRTEDCGRDGKLAREQLSDKDSEFPSSPSREGSGSSYSLPRRYTSL